MKTEQENGQSSSILQIIYMEVTLTKIIRSCLMIQKQKTAIMVVWAVTLSSCLLVCACIFLNILEAILKPIPSFITESIKTLEIRRLLKYHEYMIIVISFFICDSCDIYSKIFNRFIFIRNYSTFS